MTQVCQKRGKKAKLHWSELRILGKKSSKSNQAKDFEHFDLQHEFQKFRVFSTIDTIFDANWRIVADLLRILQ